MKTFNQNILPQEGHSPDEYFKGYSGVCYSESLEVRPREQKTTEKILGLTASQTNYLNGESSSTYPEPSGFWFDLEALNTDIFFVCQAPDLVMIGPRQNGLYNIEFSTCIYALEPASLAFWILKAPGNHILQYATLNLRAGERSILNLQRYSRMNACEGIYIAIRQFNKDGKTRLWEGANNLVQAKQHSCLYISKIE